MAQKISLSIHKPCTENWEEMKQEQGAKFCASCQKAVTDFRGLGDEQILGILTKQEGKICGRFNKHQLNRVIEVHQENKKPSLLLKAAAGIALVATTSASQAMTTNNPVKINTPIEQTAESVKEANTGDNPKNTIRGRVLDKKNKQPISLVTVTIHDTKIAVRADFDGRFMIQVPDSLAAKNEFTLSIIYGGYKHLELTIKRNQLPFKKDFFLEEEPYDIMGDIDINYVPEKQ